MNNYLKMWIPLTLIIFASYGFLCGCSKPEPPPELPMSELAESLGLCWWDIQLPEEINKGDVLQVFFGDANGNRIGSRASIFLKSTSAKSIRIIFRPIRSGNQESAGEISGYAVYIIDSRTDSRSTISRTIENVISKKLCTKTQQNNGETLNVGDLLIIFSSDDIETSLDALRGSQRGLMTEIVNYN